MHALTAFSDPMDAAAQNRALAICVGASILLHAAVLFLLPGMREGGRTAPAQILSATFAPRTSVPYVPPVPEVKAPPPKPEPRPQAVPKTEAPRPVLTAPASSAPSPQVAPTPPVAAPAPPATPTPPQAAPAPAAPSAPVQASAAPPGPPSDAADAGSLEKYRIDVMQATRQFKRYPAVAMEKGWQGKVEVRLVIAPTGMTRSSSIKTSSGYAVLDDAARAMVTSGRNSKNVTIPPALRGKEFVIDVPVIFDLKDG